MATVGLTVNLTLALTRGEVCFYKLNNKCGLTKIDLITVDNSDNIIIEYIEFENGQIL